MVNYRSGTLMNMDSDQLIVFDAEPDCFAFCGYRNVTLSVWWLQATGPAVERMTTFARATMRNHPEGMSNIHIIKEGAQLPDAAGRKGLMELMRYHERDIACAAVVVGGGGFWASALRGAVTGMWLAAATPIDMRLMGTYEEVASWLPSKHQARTGVQLDPAALIDTLERVDSRLLTHVRTQQSA
jgi:hypothetical protein